MKERPKIDLGMTGYDELFMNDQERAENRLPKIYDIPLTEIDDFPDHPFQVRLDEDMDQLVESVKERGIITPITLRKKDDGRYEIVSGHRRRKACELAGFETIPAEIKELTRDEAVILMVESNLQRSVILPSEKAFSYKMRLEAMNRQGKRSDLTSGPVGQKLDSRQELADNSRDSARQIQRYIRLTYLLPEILQMVDEGKIALRPAVELSYLNDIEQLDLVEAMDLAMATPSHAQAMDANGIMQEKYVTVTIGKKNIEEARNYFARVETDLVAHYAALGSKCVPMDADERLRALHDFYRCGDENEYAFDIRNAAKHGHDFKDYIPAY